jgi:hypothetical protein
MRASGGILPPPVSRGGLGAQAASLLVQECRLCFQIGHGVLRPRPCPRPRP